MASSQALSWCIEQTENYVLINLSGTLTRNTLSPLWEQRASLLSGYSSNRVDWYLNEVKMIDSAGLALLIELLHFHQDKTNYLIDLPKFITDLAVLFGLEDWLNTFKL